MFNLTALYNEHKDVISNLMQLRSIYSDEYINVLMKQHSRLFKSKEDVLSLVLCGYEKSENIIENKLGVSDVLISIQQDSSKLKDESLMIKIAGRKQPSIDDIKVLFKTHYSEINFSFTVEAVKRVERNNLGKKVRR